MTEKPVDSTHEYKSSSYRPRHDQVTTLFPLMILGDRDLHELVLADALQSFGNDQTARIKYLANSMLNDGNEDEELIAIYLAEEANSELIHEQLRAYLKRKNTLPQHPHETARIILEYVITSLADARKNPDRAWNDFIAQNWDWYEHVRRNSAKYAVEELLFLLIIYNYKIQQYDPRLTEQQEMIAFNGSQQAIRDTARAWLKATQSQTD